MIAKIGINSLFIEEVMADLLAVMRQYRNQRVIPFPQLGRHVDIDHLEGKAVLAAQILQGGEHVFAEVAIEPAIEGQDKLTYLAGP